MSDVVTSLADEIGKVIQDVSARRTQIKEEFIKAWLAATIPDKHMNADWIIKNVELCETWTRDRMSVSWHLRLKAEKAGKVE
jgi:hypothetical protein